MILESLNPIIEHIGSTSIQFLSAKPIIDIAVGIKNTSELDLTIDPMIKNQFIYYEVYNKVIPERRLFVGLKDKKDKTIFEECVTNKEKLDVLVKFFDVLLIELKQNINPHKGTEFSAYKLKEFFDEEVRKGVKKDEESQRIENELKHQDWYVLDQFYGTSEEKDLIEFMQETIVNLQGKYKEVYLLRNEEQYKIYDFGTGQGFQPDFILFLKNKAKLYYQIFIEPKGDNLLDIDKWKNDFLKEITEKYSDNKILKIENKNYSLIGLPLFNQKDNKEFTEAYEKLIN